MQPWRFTTAVGMVAPETLCGPIRPSSLVLNIEISSIRLNQLGRGVLGGRTLIRRSIRVRGRSLTPGQPQESPLIGPAGNRANAVTRNRAAIDEAGKGFDDMQRWYRASIMQRKLCTCCISWIHIKAPSALPPCCVHCPPVALDSVQIQAGTTADWSGQRRFR